MKLNLILGECDHPHCLAVYLTDRGTAAVQGTAIHEAEEW